MFLISELDGYSIKVIPVGWLCDFCIFYVAPQVATSPVEAPTLRSPTSTSLIVSKKGGHSNLVLILGIGAAILFIAFITLLVLCFCTSRGEKAKASPVEAGTSAINFSFKILISR